MKLNAQETLRARLTRAGGIDIGTPHPRLLITATSASRIEIKVGLVKERTAHKFTMHMPVIISDVSHPKHNQQQPLCFHGAN